MSGVRQGRDQPQEQHVINVPKASQVSRGFDITEISKGEIPVEGLVSKLGIFLAEFLIDLFFIFPFYLLKMVYESFVIIKQKYEEDQNKDYLKYAKIALAYFLDIVLPLSVVGISFKTVSGKLSGSDDIYFIWQENCFVFFISFILLISYLYNISQKDKPEFSCSFRYLTRQEHLETLGLGVVHTNLLKQLKISSNPRNNNNNNNNQSSSTLFSQGQIDFNNRIQELSKDLNIDLSLFFFDLLDSSLSKSTTQRISKEEVAALALLRETGIQAKLSARDKILWPIYDKSISSVQQESAPYQVFLLIICVKVILPLWYLIEKSKLEIQWMSILNISGFYIYMISILYSTMNNQDLRRRGKVVQEVSKLCDFKNCDETDFIKKLDVTCPLSLETWDNARRIVCQLDVENTAKFELSYIFLGFYYIFIGLICVSIYGEIFVIISQDSVYLHPLMVIHTTADFLMVTIFFFIRIWHGSTFNENFSFQRELADELIGIYEDLIQMFDMYFSTSFQEKVQNPLYKKMIQQVIEKSRIYTQDSKDQTKPQKRFRGKLYSSNEDKILMIDIMKINKETLEKIKKQISRDESMFKHKMFGEFDMPYKETVSTAILGILTCAPTIFKKLQAIFDPATAPPKMMGFSHFHQ